MKTRQEFMAEIEFETRQKSGYKSQADITLTVLNGNKGKNRVNIYFRNNTKIHFPDGVIFGIYKNRIVFEKSNTQGYKIATNNNNRSDYGCVSATVSDPDKYKDWIGDYTLKWDSFYEFWYIEREVFFPDMNAIYKSEKGAEENE